MNARLLAGGGLLLAGYLTTQLWVWVNLWPVSMTWVEAALVAIPMVGLWLALVPVVVLLVRRYPLDVEGRLPAVHLLLHVVLSFAVSLVALLLLDLSDRLLHWTTLIGVPGYLVTNVGKTVVHLHLGVGLYWVVLALEHALRYWERYRDRELEASRLETQLVSAQLRALRMQLNPHFLFNTLNSVAVLTRRDPEGAEEMLHRLAGLLHATLEHGDRDRVSLAEELELLERYLRIEETRFHDRLEVLRDVDEEALSAEVPFLVLQPLVENALRHGIGPRREGGRLELSIRRRGDRLAVRVADDGVGLPDGWDETRWGVGLTNTALRLERSYGDDHTFQVRERPGGGTEVEMNLPFEVARPAEEVSEAEGSEAASRGGESAAGEAVQRRPREKEAGDGVEAGSAGRVP